MGIPTLRMANPSGLLYQFSERGMQSMMKNINPVGKMSQKYLE